MGVQASNIERRRRSSLDGGPSHAGDTVRVLESVAAPGATTKYIDQVVRFAPPNVVFTFFGWRAALCARYDVFHAHWPEFLIRSANPALALVKSILFRLFLRRLRRRNIPVVRTLHNMHPHSPGTPLEERLLRELDALTVITVALNQTSPSADGTETRVVLHGHYVDVFADYPRAEQVIGRMAYVGRIEPYKGVTELLHAFSQIGSSQLSLRIVGRPNAELRDQVSAQVDATANASGVLEFVSDQQMVAEITASEVVVLPYREMHNSGVLLVALSLGRPVLVPRSDSNQAIADEVGAEWVLQYDGEISPEIIRRGIDDARRVAGSMPALSRRDWATVASGYADAFADAVSIRRSSEEAVIR